MSSLEFTLSGIGNLESSIHRDGNSFVLSYPCESFSSCSDFVSIFPRGHFFLEVWGGDGGYRSPAVSGGLGGYSRGILTLNSPTTVFISIGSKGGYSTTSGAFSALTYNGGGYSSQGHNSLPSNGGGGTDIRLLSNDLFHRIIVAGGGGGTGTREGNIYQGGHGGGINGSEGTDFSTSSIGGKGGFQEDGGDSVGSYSSKGSFGSGGSTSSTSYYGCGGGGGWFGGSNGHDYAAGGGGGSGYVLTSTSHLPTGYAFDHSSSYILEFAHTFFGNESISRPNSFIESGCVRITILSETLNQTLIINDICLCTSPLFIFASFYHFLSI